MTSRLKIAKIVRIWKSIFNISSQTTLQIKSKTYDGATGQPVDVKVAKIMFIMEKKKGKRKVQGVPQSQTAALPRHQEEEETDKTRQAQIKHTYEKYQE